jgi:hypothetical protein
MTIDPSNNVEGGTASGEVRCNFVRAKEDGRRGCEIAGP